MKASTAPARTAPIRRKLKLVALRRFKYIGLPATEMVLLEGLARDDKKFPQRKGLGRVDKYVAHVGVREICRVAALLALAGKTSSDQRLKEEFAEASHSLRRVGAQIVRRAGPVSV